jgi:hypothetical protein
MNDYEALVNRLAPHPGPAPTTFNILGFRFGEPARQQWENDLALHNSIKQLVLEDQLKKITDPFYRATLSDLALISGKPVEDLALPSQIKINKELTPSVVPHYSIPDVIPSIRPMSTGYNVVERQGPPTLQPRFTADELAWLERMAPEEFHARFGTLDYVDREELLAHMREAKDLVYPPPSTGIEPFLREAPRMRVMEQPGAPLETTTRTVDPNAPLTDVQKALGRAILEREEKWPRQHAMNQWEMLASALGTPQAAKLLADDLESRIKQREAAANLSTSRIAVNEARAKDYLARVGLTDAQKDRIRQLVDAQQALLEAQADLARQRASGSKTQTDIAQQRLNFDKYKFATIAKYILSTQNLPNEVRDELARDILRTLGIETEGGLWESALEKLIEESLGTRAKMEKVPSPFEPSVQTQAKPQEQPVRPGKEEEERPDLSNLPPAPVGTRKLDKITGHVAIMTKDGWKWLDGWTPKKK